MSRATPNLEKGFTGVLLPTVGPSNMADWAAFLNDLTSAVYTLHDNGTNIRPDYLPENGLWGWTAPEGVKHVYQYRGGPAGVGDVELWQIAADGALKISGLALATTTAPGIVQLATIEEVKAGTDAAKAITPATLKEASAGAPKGDIRLWPFRASELPSGWYFCNGDQYATTSAVGQELAALSAAFRSDWGISVVSSKINLPKLFHTDGRGCFLRAVDGTTRQVGSVEQDAMQRLTGNIVNTTWGNGSNSSGVFTNVTQVGGYGVQGNGSWLYGYTSLDNARQARTADENRSLNIGMTPAIYLGV